MQKCPFSLRHWFNDALFICFRVSSMASIHLFIPVFPASSCYEVKIIDWEHREQRRRHHGRRGGAQGEKQIDKKGERNKDSKGRKEDGVSTYRSTGEEREWKIVLTCHSEVWVYRRSLWEQWEDDGKMNEKIAKFKPLTLREFKKFLLDLFLGCWFLISINNVYNHIPVQHNHHFLIRLVDHRYCNIDETRKTSEMYRT